MITEKEYEDINRQRKLLGKNSNDGIKGNTCISMNLLGSRAHIDAEDLMRRECVNSIRAGGTFMLHIKARYMDALFFL
jgi:hypothetical protein